MIPNDLKGKAEWVDEDGSAYITPKVYDLPTPWSPGREDLIELVGLLFYNTNRADYYERVLEWCLFRNDPETEEYVRQWMH